MPGVANALMAVACAVTLALVGCTVLPTYVTQTGAGRVALEQGDYDRAVAEARVALLSQPGYGPAQDLLVEAFRKSVATHTERIAQAKRVLAWDTVVAEHRALAEVDRLARPILMRSPRYSMVSDLLVDRTDDLNLALGLAAETHYQAGDVLGAESAKEQKRAAAREFAKAETFIAPYKDAGARYEVARAEGTELVALLPFEDPDGSGAARQIFTAVQRDFGSGRSLQFVRFAQDGLRGADMTVRGRVTKVSTTLSPILDKTVNSKTRTVVRESGEETRYTTEERERSRTTTVRVELQIAIRNTATNREVRVETFWADAEETQTWKDRRETSDEDGALLIGLAGTVLAALLDIEPGSPGKADVQALKAKAAADVADKIRPWLSAYFTSF